MTPRHIALITIAGTAPTAQQDQDIGQTIKEAVDQATREATQEAQQAAVARQVAILSDEVGDSETLFKDGLVEASRLNSSKRELARLEGEAGNLTAYVHGLQPMGTSWTVAEIDRLLFLRYLVERGRLTS